MEPMPPPLPARPGETTASSASSQTQSLPQTAPPPERNGSTGIAGKKEAPTNAVAFVRDGQRVIGYMVPLPKPIHNGVELDCPQRFFLYTPPGPDRLPPLEGKEKKRYRVQRWWQRQVKNAKTYDGKTASFKGIHSKSIRYALWALNLIERTDVTFLARVPRKTAAHLILIHPPLAAAPATSLHDEFQAQLKRTKKLARRDAAISVVILPAVAVFDFFFPLGGLTEINLIWMAANISAWRTGRNMLKRIGSPPPPLPMRQAAPVEAAGSQTGEENCEESSERPVGEQAGSADKRRTMRRTMRGKTSGGMKAEDARQQPLQLTFDSSPAMVAMTRYLAEQCHKRNPRTFRSAGIPPTPVDVLASIGWKADRQGREQADEYEDVSWQTRQVKDDLLAVSTKAAKSWDKWCKKYAKYPERAMEEKGHSAASSAMYRMKMKKDKRNMEKEAQSGSTPGEKKSTGFAEGMKARVVGLKLRYDNRQADRVEL